jgi:hypothetical protein
LLVQVGLVARTDAGADGDRGRGWYWRRRSIEETALNVAHAAAAAESLRSATREGKLISAVERQLRCGRRAVI